MAKTLSLLSKEAVASYARDGFIAIEQIAPPHDVAVIRNTLMRLFEHKTGFDEGAQYDFVGRDDPDKPQAFPSMHNPSHYAPELARTLFRRHATEIAKRLLGPDAELYGEHALLKPAGAGPATPWHQDEAFRSPDFEHRELSIWLALQPVDAANGCMQFIPGSNAYPVLPHRSPGGDKALHPLECCGGFSAEQAVAVPLDVGGCTVHDIRTLHYTAPNTSAAPRLAYILIFNVPPSYRPGVRRFPWLDGRCTDSQVRKRRWFRKGGCLVEAVRMFPRARLTNVRWLAWAAIRAYSKMARQK